MTAEKTIEKKNMELRDKKGMSIKDLVSRQAEALGTLKSKKFKGQKAAGYVWNQICGEIGRKHTMGLFLEGAKQKELSQGKASQKEQNARFLQKDLPTLHVYLDSHALIQDFSTDLPLYQAKMAQAGLPVKKIVFQLSKKAGEPRGPQRSEGVNNFSALSPATCTVFDSKKGKMQLSPDLAKKKVPLSDLPQLSPEEAEKIQEIIKGLPPELQKSAVSAMSSSMRREKGRPLPL